MAKFFKLEIATLRMTMSKCQLRANNYMQPKQTQHHTMFLQDATTTKINLVVKLGKKIINIAHHQKLRSKMNTIPLSHNEYLLDATIQKTSLKEQQNGRCRPLIR